jgi:hypothetical protein
MKRMLSCALIMISYSIYASSPLVPVVCNYSVRSDMRHMQIMVDSNGISLQQPIAFSILNNTGTSLTVSRAWSIAIVEFFKKGKPVGNWNVARHCSGKCDYNRLEKVDNNKWMKDVFNSAVIVGFCDKKNQMDNRDEKECSTNECSEDILSKYLREANDCDGKIEAEPDSAFIKLRYATVEINNHECLQDEKGFGLRLKAKRKK